ncbi:Protein flp, partial [Rasamsonia emersonii CBS 393.64]
IMRPDIELPDLALVTYGLGWTIHSYCGEVVVEHSSVQPGFGAGVFFLPGQQFGVALFNNNMIGGGAATQVLVCHLIDKFLDTPLDKQFDWVS